MNIGINEHGLHVLENVYNPIYMRTSEGNQISICMRDNGVRRRGSL